MGVESANQLQYLLTTNTASSSSTTTVSYTKRSTNYILERKQSRVVVCNK